MRKKFGPIWAWRARCFARPADILLKLYRCFVKYDCTILEINPLAVTKDNKVIAAASVMAVDDSAMFRHPELAECGASGQRPRLAAAHRSGEAGGGSQRSRPYRGTARYTEMDGGDIGFMCGGGGGSLMMFDALLSYGGKPANYTEFGGNPPEQKGLWAGHGNPVEAGREGLVVCRQHHQQHAGRRGLSRHRRGHQGQGHRSAKVSRSGKVWRA